MPSLDFTVREVDVTIPEGIPVEICGQRLHSGPLRIALDEEAPAGSSRGSLDYTANVARAHFLIQLDLPALRSALEDVGFGVDLAPVRGEIRCVGAILPDHSFSLRGTCRLASHDLFRAGALEAQVLTGT
jgi:hypothetical protein